MGMGIGAAAVLWIAGRQGRSLSAKLGSDQEHTVFEAAVVGILLAFYMLCQMDLREDERVTIGVDN